MTALRHERAFAGPILRGITTVVHGDELAPEGAEFVYGPAAAGGKLTYVRRTGGISTTQLIQRVLDAAAS